MLDESPSPEGLSFCVPSLGARSIEQVAKGSGLSAGMAGECPNWPRNLASSNRPVRTRMPTPRPMPIGLTICVTN